MNTGKRMIAGDSNSEMTALAPYGLFRLLLHTRPNRLKQSETNQNKPRGVALKRASKCIRANNSQGSKNLAGQPSNCTLTDFNFAV